MDLVFGMVAYVFCIYFRLAALDHVFRQSEEYSVSRRERGFSLRKNPQGTEPDVALMKKGTMMNVYMG